MKRQKRSRPNRVSILLGIALLLSLAPSAFAQTEPNEREPAQATFGRRGQWVMMGSANYLNISNQTFSNSSASHFYAGAQIGLDHFVVDNFSLGFAAHASYADDEGYGATTLAETTSSYFSGGIRFGLNLALGQRFSFYPQLALMLASGHSNTKPISSFAGLPLPPSASASSLGPALDLYAPLLLHPASHVVVGFGPRLVQDFAVTRGGAYDGSQSTSLSGEFVVAGWWGGASDGIARSETDAVDVVVPAKAAAHAFGKSGEVVLTTATNAWASYRSYSQAKGSRTQVTVAPSFDYFFMDGISVGIHAALVSSSSRGLDDSGEQTHASSKSVGVAPTLGANLSLTKFASIWLRGDIGFGNENWSVSSPNGDNQHSSIRAWIALSAPLLIHPSSHFFVGAGPFVSHELSNQDQYELQNRATQFGLSLVLGGWFSGSAQQAK